MEFFRYLFLILILTGSTSVGFLISKKYVDRTKELLSLYNLINILQNKIKFTHKPLGELLKEISEINENTKISKIFLKTAQNLQNQTFCKSWNNAILEQKTYLNLTQEDLKLISTLGNTLGKTDIEGQMSEITQFKELIQTQIKKAEQETNKNSKMYKTLGTIIGLAIVIILY